MPTTDEIRDTLRLSRNTKMKEVLNRAIRQYLPGGAETLDLLERMDYMRIQDPANPHIAAEVGKLRSKRDMFVEGLRLGAIPLRAPDSLPMDPDA